MIIFWFKMHAIACFRFYGIPLKLLLLIYCMYVIHNNLIKGFFQDLHDEKLEIKLVNSILWQLLVYNYVQKLEQIQVNCLKLMLNNISK